MQISLLLNACLTLVLCQTQDLGDNAGVGKDVGHQKCEAPAGPFRLLMSDTFSRTSLKLNDDKAPVVCAGADRSELGQYGLWEQLGTPIVNSDVVWTDWIIDGSWRIQQHATVHHYRLLDDRERRLAFGTLQQCYSELERRRQSGELAAMPSQVVLCLHGLGGTRGSMQGISRVLTEQGGYTVVNFGYASTRGTIQEQALALESVLRNLRGVRQVSFVAHSMGNIVVRHVLYKLQVQGNPPPLTFHRMVMISPPNHGAELAGTVGQRPLLQVSLGKVLDQFAATRGWPLLETQLATPEFEFGILAGGRGNELGYLPRVAGDDDGLLSIDTQRLDGAADYLQTGGLHQTMPQYRSVRAATLQFLQSGRFKPL